MTGLASLLQRVQDEDHAALAAACEPGVGLCTVVGIDGGFSRRLGAQLAVGPDGSLTGSLSDGCLERQLATDLLGLREAAVIRYGSGSAKIDFRLPCGGGLDILIDPMPDREQCRRARDRLSARQPADLPLPANEYLACRRYVPALLLRAFGEGPELAALESIAAAAGIAVDPYDKAQLSLGQSSKLPPADLWTATVLLFHDHEWELPLLEEALGSGGFYIGAQGGQRARESRAMALMRRGITEEDIARIHSPIGLMPACRTPQSLAMSALVEIMGEYEKAFHAC